MDNGKELYSQVLLFPDSSGSDRSNGRKLKKGDRIKFTLQEPENGEEGTIVTIEFFHKNRMSIAFFDQNNKKAKKIADKISFKTKRENVDEIIINSMNMVSINGPRYRKMFTTENTATYELL